MFKFVRNSTKTLNLSEYILLAASSLFVIVDPLATAPAFLAMTPNDTPEQRLRTARRRKKSGGGGAKK